MLHLCVTCVLRLSGKSGRLCFVLFIPHPLTGCVSCERRNGTPCFCFAFAKWYPQPSWRLCPPHIHSAGPAGCVKWSGLAAAAVGATCCVSNSWYRLSRDAGQYHMGEKTRCERFTMSHTACHSVRKCKMRFNIHMNIKMLLIFSDRMVVCLQAIGPWWSDLLHSRWVEQ